MIGRRRCVPYTPIAITQNRRLQYAEAHAGCVVSVKEHHRAALRQPDPFEMMSASGRCSESSKHHHNLVARYRSEGGFAPSLGKAGSQRALSLAHSPRFGRFKSSTDGGKGPCEM